MFNNYINIYDFLRVAEKIKQGDLQKIISQILPQRKTEKILTAWQHNESPPKNWWDIPQVHERWNYLVTGDSSLTIYEYTAKKYFIDKNNLTAFSLCSGTGHNEIQWAKTNRFSKIEGFDLSPQRVTTANNIAKKECVESILSFRIDNALNLKLEKDFFDVIIADGALHHLTPLEKIIANLKLSLKENGLLILKDFIGPTRFQWTNTQLNYVNKLLNELPVKFKRRWKSHTIKNKHYKPSMLSMILSDPSEAVKSSNILSVLGKHFELLEMKPMGGTILQLALNDIAHNFINEDEETLKWLKFCFDFEDELLNSNQLESDFVFAVYKKR